MNDPPSAGVVVAIGPQAWQRAAKRPFLCMVLPDDSKPADFRWPSNKQSALVLETGPSNDTRLRNMAESLIAAGAPSVVALRDSELHADPRVFFETRSDHAG